MKRTKVLLLDDSLFMREFLGQGLSLDASIEIVAKAADPYEARDKIIEFRPDIMVTDVHMSRMSGLDFTRKLLPQYYLPVIIISADSAMVDAAGTTGAAAFLHKPSQSSASSRDAFIMELLATIKTIVSQTPAVTNVPALAQRVIAIGASTGGAEAVEAVLRKLPPVMPPIVIAQHMPARFTHTFAERMNEVCALTVREGSEGLVLMPGQAYVAPGDCHTTVVRSEHRYLLQISYETQGQSNCPSVDLLLASIAKAAGENGIGVILTGMGRDGAQGLLAMKNAGARTLSQDAQTSVVYGMPKAALESGASALSVPLHQIPDRLIALSGIETTMH